MTGLRRVVLIGGPLHGERVIVPGGAAWISIQRLSEEAVTVHRFDPVREKPDGEWIYRWRRPARASGGHPGSAKA